MDEPPKKEQTCDKYEWQPIIFFSGDRRKRTSGLGIIHRSGLFYTLISVFMCMLKVIIIFNKNIFESNELIV